MKAGCLVITLLLVTFSVGCQVRDSTMRLTPRLHGDTAGQQLNKTVQHLSTEVEQLRTILSKASRDTSDLVGRLYLNNSADFYLATLKKDSVAGECTIIDATVVQEGGYIFITVRGLVLGEKITFIHTNPVALNSLRDPRYPTRLVENSNVARRYYIWLEDVISYDEMRRFIPDAKTEVLEAGQSVSFYQNMNLDFHVQLTTYTDLFTALGSGKNGLVQTEVKVPFTLNNKNFPNSRFIAFQRVTPSFTFRKFDSADETVYLVPVAAGSDSMPNRMDGIQRTVFNLDLESNLLSLNHGPGSRMSMQLNGISSYGLFKAARLDSVLAVIDENTVARVRDTIDLDLRARFLYGLGVNLSLRQSEFLKIDLGMRYVWDRILSPDILNTSAVTYWNPYLQVCWQPRKGGAGNAFFRYTSFITTEQPLDTFSQFQLGFSASLTEVIGKS